MSHARTTIPAGAYVVVCDGRKALVMTNKGDETYPNLAIEEVHEQDNPATRAQGTGAPGRVHQSASPSRSSVEAPDYHDEAETAFLRQVAGRLDALLSAGKVKALIVVAPPRALGALRGFYSPLVKSAVRAELDRDMVKLPVYEIEKYLAA